MLRKNSDLISWNAAGRMRQTAERESVLNRFRRLCIDGLDRHSSSRRMSASWVKWMNSFLNTFKTSFV